MPSQLINNDKISFVVAKPFESNGKTYKVGEDFPQEDARDIEVFVRARFVIPVVEDFGDKPRHWHREVRLKSEVLERLEGTNVQLVWPIPPDSMDLDVLTHPELTPEPTEESSNAGVDEEQDELPLESGGDYDPGEHTVPEVKQYLAEHPEDEERVLAVEAEGRGRKGLLEE